ncbi:MAG: hypothetical protein IMW89_20025 [Ktedonobacteraceae bacterium]|nr:hypothetical protein [Ktedonobacteraceae bacterium]
MDILYLIDRLENLIASSRRMPLVNQIMVRESDILAVVDQMRTSIPEEIKQARRIIQEKERILAQAQAEATQLLARAREETERAMRREGLLRAAEERSQEILREAAQRGQETIQQAQDHADQLKADADAYVTDTLRALREHLLSIETEVGRTILSIERGLESMEGPPPEAESANVVDEEEVDEAHEAYTSHETRYSASQPAPRRSSLAADTMGDA